MAILKPTERAKPLVSIVTPCFNSEKYILETIASVQKQTISNWELLLIDDASTDKTIEIVQKIQHTDNRIKIFKSEENKGPAYARNLGIKEASGTYLTFLDADDLWLPKFLECCIKQDEAFVFTSANRVDEELNPVLAPFIVPEKVSYTDVLKSNSIICSTAFINIEKLGKLYMPLIKKRQDMGLWLQYLKKIDFAYGIQEPLAIYRIRKNSISRDKKSLLKYQWDFYRNVEKLSFFTSVYYMLCWAYYGYLKYRK